MERNNRLDMLVMPADGSPPDWSRQGIFTKCIIKSRLVIRNQHTKMEAMVSNDCLLVDGDGEAYPLDELVLIANYSDNDAAISHPSTLKEIPIRTLTFREMATSKMPTTDGVHQQTVTPPLVTVKRETADGRSAKTGRSAASASAGSWQASITKGPHVRRRIVVKSDPDNLEQKPEPRPLQPQRDLDENAWDPFQEAQ